MSNVFTGANGYECKVRGACIQRLQMSRPMALQKTLEL